jgi:hypothetical protein
VSRQFPEALPVELRNKDLPIIAKNHLSDRVTYTDLGKTCYKLQIHPLNTE